MCSRGRFGLGMAIGLAVGAAVVYFLDSNKRDRFIDDITDTAEKVKDSVVEGYYDAKNRYKKYRDKLTCATEDLLEEVQEVAEEEMAHIKK